MDRDNQLRNSLPHQQQSCTNLQLIWPVIILVLLLAACSQTIEKKQPSAAPSTTEKLGKIKATFSTSKPQFKQGTDVPLTIMVRNTGSKSTKLEFSSAKTHDFLVKDSGGKLVWQWSADRMFAQVILSKTLKPGEKMAFRSNWNQKTDRGSPVPAGKYKLVAELSTIGKLSKLGPLSIEIIK